MHISLIEIWKFELPFCMVSCVGEGLAHLAHHDALVVRDKAFQFGDPEEALKEEFANFFWDLLHTLVVGL